MYDPDFMTEEHTSTDVPEVVEHLARTAEDGARGFEQAAEHIGDPAIGLLFRELGMERRRFAEQLRAILSTDYREFVPEKGTVKGALHRGWIAVKDALTGDDPGAIIAAAEEGEDYALEQWNEAAATPLPSEIAELVRRQRDAVERAHDRVRALELAAG